MKSSGIKRQWDLQSCWGKLKSRSREPQNGKKNQSKISPEQVRKDDKFQLSEKLTTEAEHWFTCRIDLSTQTASQSPNKTNTHLLFLDVQTGHHMTAAEHSRSQVWKPIPTGRHTLKRFHDRAKSQAEFVQAADTETKHGHTVLCHCLLTTAAQRHMTGRGV